MVQSQSLLLDLVNWDLTVDSKGNIAVCSLPYSCAQDAASAIRLFLGELYYDTTQGVDYFGQILGHIPPNALFRAKIKAAALTATNAVTATVSITAFTKRAVTGTVVVTDINGTTSTASWAVPLGVGAV